MWKCPKCGRTFKNENQHHFCGKAPETIDEYILAQDEGWVDAGKLRDGGRGGANAKWMTARCIEHQKQGPHSNTAFTEAEQRTHLNSYMKHWFKS